MSEAEPEKDATKEGKSEEQTAQNKPQSEEVPLVDPDAAAGSSGNLPPNDEAEEPPTAPDEMASAQESPAPRDLPQGLPGAGSAQGSEVLGVTFDDVEEEYFEEGAEEEQNEEGKSDRSLEDDVSLYSRQDPFDLLDSSNLQEFRKKALQALQQKYVAESEEEKEEEICPELARHALELNCREAMIESMLLRDRHNTVQNLLVMFMSRKRDISELENTNVKTLIDMFNNYTEEIDELKLHEQETLSKWDERLNDKREEVGDLLELTKYRQKSLIDLWHRLCKGFSKDPDVTAIRSKKANELKSALEECWKEQAAISLSSIKCQHAIRNLRAKLKKREKRSEIYSDVDYEEWTVQNQKCSERMQHVNMLISLLKKKQLAETQILTHYKEKLHFVQRDNKGKRQVLRHVDDLLSETKAQLRHLTEEREDVRKITKILTNRCGLLQKPRLLVDYGAKKRDREALEEDLRDLKFRYAQLSRQSTRLSECIYKRRSTVAAELSKLSRL